MWEPGCKHGRQLISSAAAAACQYQMFGECLQSTFRVYGHGLAFRSISLHSGVLKTLLNLERGGNLQIHQPSLLPQKTHLLASKSWSQLRWGVGWDLAGGLGTHTPHSGSVGAELSPKVNCDFVKETERE